VQQVSTDPYHLQESSRDVLALIANFQVNRTSSAAPQRIGLLDDVLTTGAHFVAAKHVLSEAFPGVEIVGFFVARRAITADEIS
jgi:predicted amidophosphoribosyltransferase